LIDWAAGLGREVTFGIEGTGSYGAGALEVVIVDSLPFAGHVMCHEHLLYLVEERPA
jgi:hypothetical protein